MKNTLLLKILVSAVRSRLTPLFKIFIFNYLNFIHLFMKNTLLLFFLIINLFSFGNPIIPKIITKNIKIAGKCDQCKKQIENAGFTKKIAQINWNKETQIATITYNENSISFEQILKQIALNGFDNELYLAPEKIYAQLPECCQYDRIVKKIQTPSAITNANMENMGSMGKMDNMGGMTNMNEVNNQNPTNFQAIFEIYFELKNGLVKTDPSITATNASKLLKAIELIKMENLTPTEHTSWMSINKNLSTISNKIAMSKDIIIQRNLFIELSTNMYNLLKSTKQQNTIYVQFCPMANNGKGANWLSKDADIKNPYFGSMMLSCGSTIETFK